MVELYATLVIKREKTISDVPSVIRERVKAVLRERGFADLAGDSDDSQS